MLTAVATAIEQALEAVPAAYREELEHRLAEAVHGVADRILEDDSLPPAIAAQNAALVLRPSTGTGPPIDWLDEPGGLERLTGLIRAAGEVGS